MTERIPSAKYGFPRGFLWGAATSSHQVEGNNTNNDWAEWEQAPGRILNGDKAGLANDWWGGRWREDFDRAAEAGQNAHRFSIEWSRVQPGPDRWNEHALDHYREIAKGALERGLFPLVTLHHFTNPLWLSASGAWTQAEIVPKFAAFADKVVEAMDEYVTTWVTINEPNVLAALGYLIGDFPPGGGDLNTAFAAMENMVRAHAAAYHVIHARQPRSRVGLAINYRSLLPKRGWSPLDRAAAWFQQKLYNDFFPDAAATGKLNYLTRTVAVPEAAGTQDFIGINYYTRERIAFDLRLAGEAFARREFRPDAEVSPTGLIAHEPLGFYEAFTWANRYGLPIIVTENGIEDAADELRPRYLAAHIHQLWRAVNFNFPIKGYFHWSNVDNFEWDRGWTQRFGLWELDRITQARRKRPSADLYAAICKANGLTSEMVRQYAPAIFNDLFPV
jgi:beta-glucosidase